MIVISLLLQRMLLFKGEDNDSFILQQVKPFVSMEAKAQVNSAFFLFKAGWLKQQLTSVNLLFV